MLTGRSTARLDPVLAHTGSDKTDHRAPWADRRGPDGEQPEIGHACELLRRDADQVGIGRGDEAGQRRYAETGPRRGEHVALRRAPHDERSLPGDDVAPARQMRIRRLI